MKLISKILHHASPGGKPPASRPPVVTPADPPKCATGECAVGWNCLVTSGADGNIGDLWCYIGVEGYEHLHMEMFNNEQLEPIEFSTLKLHGKKDGVRLLQAASAMIAKAHRYLPTNSIHFYSRPQTSQLILKLTTREASEGNRNRTFPSFEEASSQTEEFVTLTKTVLDTIDEVGAGTDVSQRIYTAVWKSLWEFMAAQYAQEEGVNKVYRNYCKRLLEIATPLRKYPPVWARLRLSFPIMM